MKTFKRNRRVGLFWRMVTQFALFCVATNWVFAATKPTISNINPNSALAGSAGFTLIVTGSDFQPLLETTTVNWNGSARPITSQTATELQATISASDVAAAGSAQVTVTNTDALSATATSDPVTFTINNPAPTLSSVVPASAVAGSAAFTLTVNGSNFVSGATVRWNGADRATTFVSSVQLTASIAASDVAAEGTASVTVLNPSPTVGASNALTFTIQPIPTTPLTITTPATLPSGVANSAYSQTFAASGGTPPYTWDIASSPQQVPPGLSLNASTGVLGGTPSKAGRFTFKIRVTDSAQPTHQRTGDFTVTINNPVPSISGLNPSSVQAGDQGFTLTVNGSNFVSGATVRWNGSDRTTTFSSATRVTGSISAGDIASARVVSVTVANPAPGGGASNALSFTISSPAPPPLAITSSSPLPNGFVGSSYSQTLSASGGTSPYTWSIAAGSLPAELTLNSASAVISGTVTASGSFQFTVRVRDSLSVSADKSFQLLIDPALPAISINGPSDPVAPAQQLTVEMSLAEPYPSPLSGQMTLTFTPNADEPSDDPAIQFATGDRTVDFTIPANSTNAVFPNSATSAAFQSGTVAGTIKMSIALQSDGSDVTPSPGPSRMFTVNRTVPTISRLSIASRSASGFDVEIIGFSTPRSLTQIVLAFTARAGTSLGTSTFTVPLGPSSSAWFQGDASKPFGSLFQLVIPFAVQGDVNSIQSVSARLSNAEGTSEALSTNL